MERVHQWWDARSHGPTAVLNFLVHFFHVVVTFLSVLVSRAAHAHGQVARVAAPAGAEAAARVRSAARGLERGAVPLRPPRGAPTHGLVARSQRPAPAARSGQRRARLHSLAARAKSDAALSIAGCGCLLVLELVIIFVFVLRKHIISF